MVPGIIKELLIKQKNLVFASERLQESRRYEYKDVRGRKRQEQVFENDAGAKVERGNLPKIIMWLEIASSLHSSQ